MKSGLLKVPFPYEGAESVIEKHKSTKTTKSQIVCSIPHQVEHEGVPDVAEKAKSLRKSETHIPSQQQVQQKNNETVIEKHKSQPSSLTQ